MKKSLSVLLVICMLLASCLTLASCVHECEFATEWTKDADYHWHVCTDEDCEEIADKAEHTWECDEGVITTKPTQDATGVRTFICEVCSYTKTEPVEFTGLSEEEWNAALEPSVFENFEYNEVSTTTGSGVSVNSEVIYKFTEATAWVYMSVAGQIQESYAPDTAYANQARSQVIESIKDMAPYASFEYDAETKTYKATESIAIDALNASTSDITLTFDNDGKLVKIEYTISFVQSDINFTATSTATISNYGTVVLNPAD